MKTWCEYETVADPSEDGGGAPADTDSWQGPSQDEWNQLSQFQQNVTPFLSELAQALQDDNGQQPQQQQYGQPIQQEPEFEFDPFDPTSVQQYIQSQVSSGVESALDPYSGVLGLVATREGEALAHKELETLQKDVGQFDQDAALLIASGMIDQGHEPQQALRTSAEYARDYESRIRADEREVFKKELQGLATGGDVPAGDGRSAETPPTVPTGQDRYKVAVENALARRRASGVVG